jgi:succinoglycan biosynthesis protein ExoA
MTPDTAAREWTPLVSVVMPVRNEARFIAELVRTVLAQDYPPHLLEVIVADGLSDDGTREILAALAAEDRRLTVIDNPPRIVSTGLNVAVAAARGEVIIRIDGHAAIAPQFIRENVRVLAEHPEAWGVGGPIRHAATTPFGKAVAIAMSHRVGIGNAAHRYANYEGYSDTAQFPAFRRWVFDRVGTFDVRLVRNQDDEFNYRITQAGGKIFISPRVEYFYFVRECPAKLFTQYFQYGFWRIPVISKHRRPTTLRQVAPIAFYAVCGALAIVAAVIRQPLVGLALPAFYAAVLCAAGVTTVGQHALAVACRVPLAIATIHAGYAFGIAYGLWANVFRSSAWDTGGPMATLTR